MYLRKLREQGGIMEKDYWDNVSDNYLVERIRITNCENSLEELIKRHSGLCFKIITRYAKSFYANNIDINEASSDKNLIIWNSAKSFNTEKNVKFSMYRIITQMFFYLNCNKIVVHIS